MKTQIKKRGPYNKKSDEQKKSVEIRLAGRYKPEKSLVIIEVLNKYTNKYGNKTEAIYYMCKDLLKNEK